MTFCDYHIMEYTCSELQSEGVPFAIVLYLDRTESGGFEGFVLCDWENVIRMATEYEASSVRSFMTDLQYYSQSDPASSMGFFKSLGNLSTGPIRTFVSGACTSEDLDGVVSTFFLRSVSTASWMESFHKVQLQDGVGR
jgi:hypothetical protein